MSKRISFSCNLCGLTKDTRDLIGIWWEYSPTAKRDEITEKPPNDSENHVCLDCAAGISSILGRRKR